MNRRRFLKYAGAATAAVGASALGLDYLLSRRATLPSETISTAIRAPPVISDLKWTPTRIQNGKVYDGSISFAVETDGSAFDVGLSFAPIYPAELSQTAYAQENVRSYSFPTFLSSQSISQPVTNLVGGKQFQATVSASDRYGNQAKSAIDIDYVREYEVSLPRQVTASATYLIEFVPGELPSHSMTEPLLGRYLSRDTNAVEKHVDWASGHSLGLFWLDITFSRTFDIARNILAVPMTKDMKFAVFYEPRFRLKTKSGYDVDFQRYYAENLQQMKSDFGFFAANLFKMEQYLSVGRRPVVCIMNSHQFLGDTGRVISELRNFISSNYGTELYLISDHIDPRIGYPSDEAYTRGILPYDAIAGWGGGFYGEQGIILGKSYEEQLELLFKPWYDWALRNGKGIVPSMKPGENTTHVPWGSPNNYVLARSPELFKKRVEILLKYLDPKLKIFRIDTWNDWDENTFIEPSIEDRLLYIEKLYDTLAGY